MPLAILGGSFDPVHCGHVEMAKHVLDNRFASEVLVIPAFISPFKATVGASAQDRLDMVRLAFANCSHIEVDDREIRRGGSSFMIETLEELQQENPDRSLRLILGADNLSGFPQWHRAGKILDLAQVLVLGRHGHKADFLGPLPPSFISVPGFDQRVSSTEIRAILAAGSTADDLLPVAVERHIRDNGLYH